MCGARLSNRSSILIMVLWVLSILSTFTVYLGFTIQQRIMVISRIEENQDLHSIAEAGVKRAIAEFAGNRYASAFVSLGENCTNNPSVFKDIFLGRGNFSVIYDAQDWQTKEASERFGFIDEERKININRAPELVLNRLFQAVGMDSSEAGKLAFAIIDYRDADTITNEGVSEEFVYMSAGKGINLKNGDFEFLEELKLVPGMTEKLFETVKNFITIYGSGAVNINTASADTLGILGLGDDLIPKIMSFRCGADGREWTDDDNSLDDLHSAAGKIALVVTLNEDEFKALENFLVSGLVSTRSSHIRVDCTGFLNKKNKAVSVSCVADINGKVLYWKERRHMGVRRVFL